MAEANPRRGRLSRAIGYVLDASISVPVVDYWLSRVNPILSWDRPLARVISRKQIGPEAVTLVLECNRHCPKVLPGQHVDVIVEVDGRRLKRCYSPSIGVKGQLSLSLKTVEGGRVSRHLCENIRVGDVVELSAAYGDMVLPSHGEWVFAAAGSGITPLVSMIRALASQGMPFPITLMYWARREVELWFAEELRALASQHPNLNVFFYTTREISPRADVRTGRLNAVQLEQAIGDLSGHHVYACGSADFVEAVRELMAPVAASFMAEAFSLPVMPIEEDGEVSVHLSRQGVTLTLPRGQTLLTALEAAGLKPKSGCRMGICHTCVCGKSAGVTKNILTGEVISEPASSLRLCVSRPSTDLVLDL